MNRKQAVISVLAGAALVASASAFADAPRFAHGHNHWAKHRTLHGKHQPQGVRHVMVRPAFASARTVVVHRPVHFRPAPVYYVPAPVVYFDRGSAAVVFGSVIGGLVGYHLATH